MRLARAGGLVRCVATMIEVSQLVALALGAWVLGTAAPEGVSQEWHGPLVAGQLSESIREASGLAVSRREAGLFWTHEDSGGQPVLQAISADGSRRGTLRIVGVKNVDWEDIASFTLNGRAWLLVADTGDNGARRTDCVLYVIPEPDPAMLGVGVELSVEVAWRIPVRYPDGPRDCEAVAVDAAEGKVYLLAKRTVPHGLYVLPLRPTADGALAVAKRVGEMPAFPPAPEAWRKLRIPTGAFRAQPTGMDFTADGSAAVIVTYGDVLVYPKNDDKSWVTAFSRPPLLLAGHGLPQAEAVAFGPGTDEIVVTSEGGGAAILQYRRR